MALYFCQENHHSSIQEQTKKDPDETGLVWFDLIILPDIHF